MAISAITRNRFVSPLLSHVEYITAPLVCSFPFPSHHGAGLTSDTPVASRETDTDAEEETEGLDQTDEENVLELLEELDGKKGKGSCKSVQDDADKCP